jgi:hypothetical protein
MRSNLKVVGCWVKNAQNDPIWLPLARKKSSSNPTAKATNTAIPTSKHHIAYSLLERVGRSSRLATIYLFSLLFIYLLLSHAIAIQYPKLCSLSVDKVFFFLKKKMF